MHHSDRVCRTFFEPKRPTFPTRCDADGNQVIPVMGVTSAVDAPQSIFGGFLRQSCRIVLAMSAYA
jgi:hypothetical protein